MEWVFDGLFPVWRGLLFLVSVQLSFLRYAEVEEKNDWDWE